MLYPCTDYRAIRMDRAWQKLAEIWDSPSYTFAPRGLLMNFLGVFVKSYTELTRREDWPGGEWMNLNANVSRTSGHR